MQDLQLIGVHEDGEHLLLGGADDARFRMPVDEALRSAIRRDRPRLGQTPKEPTRELRPRDVQALIRAGASTDEAATRAGWPIEKVHRYGGPILAEREHVAGLAQNARLRARSGAASHGGAPTLSARVTERLKGRGVEVTDSSWDSWRAEGGPWTVVLTFAAGGRQRQASWSFDLADRTVSAVDDEARWLSEDVQTATGPIPAPRPGSGSVRGTAGRATAVYDVEAEGGMGPAAPVEHPDEPVDLMTAMRRRSTARGRRKPGGHRGSAHAPASLPIAGDVPSGSDHATEQALPLENLPHEAALEPSRTQSARSEAAPTAGSAPAEILRAGEPEEGFAQHEQPTPATPPRAREAARRTGRPSVPAWDEIMFGSKPGADRSSS